MKSKKSIPSSVLLAFSAIGTMVLIGWRVLAVEAVYPVEHARQAFVSSVWSRVVGAFRGAAAQAENGHLRREVAAREILRSDVARLQAENARLRRALDFSEGHSGVWIPAEVLSTGGGAAGVRDALRIGKGTLSGVVKGAVVAVPEGLVGIVTAVSPHTAEVTLVTDPSVKAACEIGSLTSRGATGVLSGSGGDLLLVRYLRIVNRAEMRPGAAVFTSGRGGVFPRGLTVGTLHLVRESDHGPEGEVRPAVDCSSLTEVFVRHER